MEIIILPFFLIAIGAVLAIVDLATMGKSTSAMGRSYAGTAGVDPSLRPSPLPGQRPIVPTVAGH